MELFIVIKQHCVEIAAATWNYCSIKVAAAIPIGMFGYFIGDEHSAVVLALLSMIGIDFITKLMAVYMNGDIVQSRKALKSATKVVVYGLFISASHLTENIVPGTTFIDESTIAFLALTEMISIMENIGQMGYTVPQKLLNRLQDLRAAK